LIYILWISWLDFEVYVWTYIELLITLDNLEGGKVKFSLYCLIIKKNHQLNYYLILLKAAL
jgi:hypothetical protein